MADSRYRILKFATPGFEFANPVILDTIKDLPGRQLSIREKYPRTPVFFPVDVFA